MMTREEFKAAVTGKTPEEVIALVGKPKSTTADRTGETWFYEGVTIDPVTGKNDFTTVVFSKNVVERIRFSN